MRHIVRHKKWIAAGTAGALVALAAVAWVVSLPSGNLGFGVLFVLVIFIGIPIFLAIGAGALLLLATGVLWVWGKITDRIELARKRRRFADQLIDDYAEVHYFTHDQRGSIASEFVKLEPTEEPPPNRQ